MRAPFAGLLLLCACAPLRLSNKPQHCQSNYDACLNACPKPPPANPPYAQNLAIDTASCTKQCNEVAEKCQ